MKIVVIDGQGGKIGKLLVEAIREKLCHAEIWAVGTNNAATACMIKGGAKSAATGENAVIVACRKADVIVGSANIVVADSMLGEITPAMAAAIGQSQAARVLIPFNKCDNYFIGAENYSISELVFKAVDCIGSICPQ